MFYFGIIDDLFNWFVLLDVDCVVLIVIFKVEECVKYFLEKLCVLFQLVIVLFDINGFNLEMISFDDIVGVYIVCMFGYEENLGCQFVKCLQDVVFGSFLIFVILLVMVIIVLFVKFDSCGFVLFVQKCEGFNGCFIKVYKFCIMWYDLNVESKKLCQVELNDFCVIWIGGVLCKISFDELLQLFNVFVGFMLLVGLCFYVYGMCMGGIEIVNLVVEYVYCYCVKFGIIGWVQVNGLCGLLYIFEVVCDCIKWDVEYIFCVGFFFDFWIMLKMVFVLLGDKLNVCQCCRLSGG